MRSQIAIIAAAVMILVGVFVVAWLAAAALGTFNEKVVADPFDPDAIVMGYNGSSHVRVIQGCLKAIRDDLREQNRAVLESLDRIEAAIKPPAAR